MDDQKNYQTETLQIYTDSQIGTRQPCPTLVQKKVISLVITAPSLLRESRSNLKVNL
jgi:hypothetical protein